MRARTRRAYMLIAALLAGAFAIGLMAYVLREQANLFYTPQLLLERGQPELGKRVKIGGYVQAGSIAYTDTGSVLFVIEDMGINQIYVEFLGVLPDLFGAGQGVVVDGTFVGDGRFEAGQVLAKHDEYYAPPGLGDGPGYSPQTER